MSHPVKIGNQELKVLKQQINQHTGSLNALEHLSDRQKAQRLYPERPLLTMDFLPSECSTKRGLEPLGKVSPKEQEEALVEDLLYCMIGIEGTYLKPTKLPGKVHICIDDSIDASLKELTNRITPLCQHYSQVVQFAEKNMQLENVGRTNQALAGAINQLLKDYYIFVTQLRTEHARGELTLSRVWFHVQPTLQTMTMLADLCSTIERSRARGGRTLSLLHHQIVSQSASENCRLVAEFLMKNSSKPYFEILSHWIHHGVIVDAGKDFFVEDNEVIERAAYPVEYSDDYWERRYTIRSEQIPDFLENYSDMILRTGKYLNVIQQCDKSVKWPEVIDDLTYLQNSERYAPILDKAYAFASKTLLDLLIKEKDLFGHLRSVKHYFLLDQGDFVVQFLDLCALELAQNVSCVESARLESLLELALRTSAANTDPYKDNVGIELLPYNLIYQMCKILSIDTDAESEFKGPASTADLSGLDAFAFNYEVQWPVSLILNRRSLACYQMLLRQLFFCKHVERKLCEVWVETKGSKTSMKNHAFQQFSSCFALRQKMLNFLQNLEYYMMFEVLEPNWEEMIAKIRNGKVTNVDQVLDIHNEFLNTSLNDCMLSSPQLLMTVRKLLDVCSDFAETMRNFSAGCDDMDDMKDHVSRSDLSFKSALCSLLDKISRLGRENYNEKILNIIHRLDFNGFYSQGLNQFECSS